MDVEFSSSMFHGRKEILCLRISRRPLASHSCRSDSNVPDRRDQVHILQAVYVIGREEPIADAGGVTIHAALVIAPQKPSTFNLVKYSKSPIPVCEPAEFLRK